MQANSCSSSCAGTLFIRRGSLLFDFNFGNFDTSGNLCNVFWFIAPVFWVERAALQGREKEKSKISTSRPWPQSLLGEPQARNRCQVETVLRFSSYQEVPTSTHQFWWVPRHASKNLLHMTYSLLGRGQKWRNAHISIKKWSAS